VRDFASVRLRGDGQALPMIFHVHAYVDDHVLKAAAKTAKDALQKRSSGMSSGG